jgi:hypothetical protein
VGTSIGSGCVNASPDQGEHATLKVEGGFIHRACPECVRGWFSANSRCIMQGVKPIVKRVAKWLGWGFLAFGLLFFIGFRWGLTPLPKPPRGIRIAPLRPPLKVEEIKADNAAYYYMQAAKQVGGYKQTKESEAQMDALLNRDTSGETTAIKQTLADSAEALQLVRKGTSTEFCQMPVLNLADDGLNNMAQWRRLARLLCCAGELARRDGNYEQARDEYLTVMKFGRDCATGGPIISMLMGNAISGIGTKALRTLILENTLPPETSKTVAVELMRLEADFPPLAETLRYELIYSKHQLDDTVFKNHHVAGSLAVSHGAWNGLCDAAYGDMIQEAQKPYWQSDSKKVVERWASPHGKWIWLFAFNRPFPRILVGMILPVLETTYSRATRCDADLRATAVVCALTGYARVRGVPPERLDQLVPDFLTAVPIDPFDGKPLRYRREGAGWVVWSVGSDMKDDNAAWHEFKYRKGEERKGGDIYFKSTEPQDDLAAYRANLKTQVR